MTSNRSLFVFFRSEIGKSQGFIRVTLGVRDSFRSMFEIPLLDFLPRGKCRRLGLVSVSNYDLLCHEGPYFIILYTPLPLRVLGGLSRRCQCMSIPTSDLSGCNVTLSKPTLIFGFSPYSCRVTYFHKDFCQCFHGNKNL